LAKGDNEMRLALFLLLGLLLIFSMAFAGIEGSKHDLSTSGGITDKSSDQDRICIFCHTPHNASPAIPLWNHEASVGPWTPYTGLDLDHTNWTAATGPNELSKLCLSCHDGTVGVNSLVNGTNPTMGSGTELDATGKILSTRSAYLDTDLSDDHPISFDYTLAQATDAELQTLTWVKSNSGLDFYGASEQSMECSTCHDVHEFGATADMQPFLNESISASNLCLKCHIK
jgi:hypothetical protein